ncbi:DNA topoisomerase IV subunit A [Brucepastera parasyntrophica]|uniref:DNA topoisomerase IV subunit A n=1 Tax=Brucepastera parasyntrophica TaxID=2880008 RepID=UPI00210C9451|nr:DNA topoisomerase IV subunit A [Brucepastera parasyntrophica]ULQ59578.1 DNA topoisomerase IV subunit A [Brucepastera parasyntrophica]
MDYIKSLFNKNFLEYASYVIRDRAIPDLEDGLKPVQRRILHSLFEMDDGKFHKVANVVGHCMKYHPHGDASIGGALVVLANKDLFIDKQGNFGNILTGDEASAARYIECRSTPIAKDVFYNPEITRYIPSYDGRNKEPVAFRAKLPVILCIGAEGIAVGMSTRILPHNIREVIEAEKACLAGKKFQLYPDFPTRGLVDVSDYEDGLGKVLVRAKLDTSDEKRIVIREIPFGSTTDSLILSIENAARSGKIKISEINDYTTDKVEIELKLPRGVYAEDVTDSLYAFTECEQSISCNLLVIRDNFPVLMTVSDVIRDHAKRLVKILKEELELEKINLLDRLHMRTLERIFIEERIYKRIEQMKTAEGVISAVLKGFEPFRAELIRDVTEEDVDRLLKIPIRRISLYDINKNREEVAAIKERIKEINKLLKNLVDYAITTLDAILSKLPAEATARRTTIGRFTKTDAKEVVTRDTPLRYDEETGYLGTSVSNGKEMLKVTPYDRILVMRKSGVYSVMDVPEKLFVDKGMWYVGFSEKEFLSKQLFTIIYKDGKTGYPCIKRCRIEGYILNRDYLIVPDDATVLLINTQPKFQFTVTYEPKPRVKTTEQTFKAQDYAEKGLKALGVRLNNRIAVSAAIAEKKPPAPDKTEAGEACAKRPAELLNRIQKNPNRRKRKPE